MQTPLTMTLLAGDQALTQWTELEPWIAPALEFSPDVTIQAVKAAVRAGTYKVIAVERDHTLAGVVVLKFQSQDQSKTAWVLAIGGRWICHTASIAQFKEFLRGQGVNKLQGIARPSVARLWMKLGVTPVYTVMETNI